MTLGFVSFIVAFDWVILGLSSMILTMHTIKGVKSDEDRDNEAGSYLTCTDFLPTRQTLLLRGGNSSWHLGSARQRRTTLPISIRLI